MHITKKELDRLIREEVSTQINEGVKNIKFTAFISPETHPDGIEVFVDAIVRTSDRDEEQLGPDVEIVRVADATSNRELPYEEYESAYSDLGDLAYQEIGIYEPDLEESMMLDLGRFDSFLNEEVDEFENKPEPTNQPSKSGAKQFGWNADRTTFGIVRDDSDICWACDGNRVVKDDDGTEHPCEECGGTGVLSEEEPESEEGGYCSTCFGSGEGRREGTPCRNCKGSGTEPPKRNDDDYEWLE